MKCHACGSEYEDGAQFCPTCGAPPASDKGFEPDTPVEATVAMTFDASKVDDAPADPKADEAAHAPPSGGRGSKRSGTIIGMPGIKREAGAPLPPMKAKPAPRSAAKDLLKSAAASHPTPGPVPPPAAQPDASLEPAPPAAPPSRPAAQPAAPVAAPAKKGGALKFVIVGVLVAVVVLAVLFLVLGRGGGLGGTTAKSAAANIPKDVDVAGGLDVSALRSSWIYSKLEPQLKASLEEEPSFKSLSEEANFKIEDVSSVTFGASSVEGKEPIFAAAISGSFDQEKMNTTFDKHVAQGKEDRVQEIGGARFFGRKTRELLGAVASDTLVFGHQAMAERVMGVRTKGEPSVTDNEGLMAAVGAVGGSATLWVAGTVTKAMLEMAGPQMAVLGDRVKAGDRFALSVDLSGDVVIRLAGITTDEARAKSDATELNAAIQMGRLMASGAGASDEQKEDLGKLFDGIKVEQSGPKINVTISVPKALVEKYLAEADKMEDLLR